MFSCQFLVAFHKARLFIIIANLIFSLQSCVRSRHTWLSGQGTYRRVYTRATAKLLHNLKVQKLAYTKPSGKIPKFIS